MTYVPVSEEERKGHGRPSMEIRPALLAKLQHSRSTGDLCRLDILPDDDPAEIDALKREIIRAGYRHFPNHTIYKKYTAEYLEFYVGPKAPRRKPKKAAGEKK